MTMQNIKFFLEFILILLEIRYLSTAQKFEKKHRITDLTMESTYFYYKFYMLSVLNVLVSSVFIELRGNSFLNQQIFVQSSKAPEQEEDEEMNITPEKNPENANNSEMSTLSKKPEVGKSEPLGSGKKIIRKVPLSEANKMIAAGVARFTDKIKNGLADSPAQNGNKATGLQPRTEKKDSSNASYQPVSSGVDVDNSQIDSLEAGEFEKK